MYTYILTSELPIRFSFIIYEVELEIMFNKPEIAITILKQNFVNRGLNPLVKSKTNKLPSIP